MAEQDLILKLDIAPGKSPEAESVAQTLAAFASVLRAAAAVIEPDALLSVEVVGVEPGSQMFRLALKRLERGADRVKDGGKGFPLVSKAAMTLGGLIGSSVIVTGVALMITPDPRIPQDQMAVFEEMNRNMAESVELQRKTMEFYGIVNEEPAYEGFRVLRDDRVTAYQIPRSEFAERSGLWIGEDEQPLERVETRNAVWDVTLIKPALISEKRRWTFARDGLEFTALMTDKAVLDAIHDRTLQIQIAEGVMMKIEVQYKERFNGTSWIPVNATRQVKKVLYPAPPLKPLPLFPAPDQP